MAKLKSRGQVWIETVIYTLIGLAIIGILLSFAKPAIDEKRDKILIEQSIELISSVDSKIEEVRYYGPGNSREIEIKLKKGVISVNAEEDYISFFMDSRHMFSEPGKEIADGKMKIKTIKKGDNYEVSLKISYNSTINITVSSVDKEKTFQSSPSSYKLFVKNNGIVNNLVNIDFS